MQMHGAAAIPARIDRRESRCAGAIAALDPAQGVVRHVRPDARVHHAGVDADGIALPQIDDRVGEL